MATRPRDRVLPTPPLRNLADDLEALHRAITAWGDRPYIELGDYVTGSRRRDRVADRVRDRIRRRLKAHHRQRVGYILGLVRPAQRARDRDGALRPDARHDARGRGRRRARARARYRRLGRAATSDAASFPAPRYRRDIQPIARTTDPAAESHGRGTQQASGSRHAIGGVRVAASAPEPLEPQPGDLVVPANRRQHVHKLARLREVLRAPYTALHPDVSANRLRRKPVVDGDVHDPGTCDGCSGGLSHLWRLAGGHRSLWPRARTLRLRRTPKRPSSLFRHATLPPGGSRLAGLSDRRK
jgi:hypothetical protein